MDNGMTWELVDWCSNHLQWLLPLLQWYNLWLIIVVNNG